jgi:hypothetical protein
MAVGGHGPGHADEAGHPLGDDTPVHPETGTEVAMG